MADRKITDLTALAAGSQATGDLVTVVDVSEAAAADKNKKMTMENLFKGIPSSVGIGTASPGAALDVVGNSTMLRLYDGTNTSTGKFSQSGDVITLSQAGTAAGALAFATGSGALGSERMRIDGDGRLLVGTTSSIESNSVIQAVDASNSTIIIGNTSTSASGEVVINLAPSNSITGGQIKCIATEDFSTGANRTAFLEFRTRKDGTFIDAMRIDSSGKVGINTPSPDQLLTVNGGVGINNTGAGGGSPILTITNNSGNPFINCTSNSTALTFGYNSTERMRIDSSGRLLVGTTTAVGTSNAVIIKGTSGVSNASIYLGNTANASTLVAGNTLGFIEYGAADGGTGAQVLAAADGTWSSTSDCPTRLVFSTTADGAGSPTERMRISNGGNVGINSTSPQSFGLFVVRNSDNRYTAIESSGKLVARYDDNSASHFNILVRNTGITAVGHSANIGFYLGQSGTAKNGGIISSVAESNYSTDAHADAALVFSSASNNSNNEVFRITSDKYLRMNSGSGGIQFGGDTAAANALDDYEEGTFTPSYGNLTNFDHSTQVGKYVKVGKVVTVYLMLATQNAASIGNTGAVSITGLPFAVENNSNAGLSMPVLTHDNRFTNNPNYGQVQSGSDTTIILFKDKDMDSAAHMGASDFNATNSSNFNLLSVNFTYEVD